MGAKIFVKDRRKIVTARYSLKGVVVLVTLAAVVIRIGIAWPDVYLIVALLLFIAVAFSIVVYRRKSLLCWLAAFFVLYLAFDGPVCGLLMLKSRSVANYRLLAPSNYPRIMDSCAKRWVELYLSFGFEREYSSEFYMEVRGLSVTVHGTLERE